MSVPYSGRAGSVLAILCVLAMVLAADETHPAPRIAHVPPAESINLKVVERARNLLSDSWVSDGKHGVFIEHAWSLDVTPFSLYDTYWNVKLAKQTARPLELDSAAVKYWLASALRGKQAGSGMPAIVQIAYATELEILLGIAPDRRVVAAALQTLANGGRYRSGFADTAPNWGSTAIAVHALNSLGMHASQSLVDESISAVRATVDSKSVAVVINDLLPLLQIVAVTGSKSRLPDGLVQHAIANTSVLLSPIQKDSVWLLAWTNLIEVAKLLGFESAVKQAPVCSQIDADVATPPSHAAPDAQLFYGLSVVGCGRAMPKTGHSRAGWPTPAAVKDSTRATVAGLRLAKEVGVSIDYVPGIRSTLHDVWLPAEEQRATSADNVSRLAAHARLAELCVLAGGCSKRPLPDVRDIRMEQLSVFELFLILSAAQYSRQSDDSSRVSRAASQELLSRRPSADSPTHAAALEIASRATSNSALHSAALAIIGPLHRDGYVFESAENGAVTGAISLTSSVVGVWITRAKGDIVHSWISAGLCTSDLACADGPRDLAKGQSVVSLRMLAIIAACQQPGCGEDYPIIF